MSRVGISNFRLYDKCYFDRIGNLSSVKYRVTHHLVRNGVEVEFDNGFHFENILTDLVEWVFELGKESRK